MNRATSLYLDLIRPAAAFIVLLSHASFRALTGGQLRVMASTGVQAVDVFFVLSGFVIAHVCAARESNVRSYIVSRAARIYSVAIPALILTAVVDFIGLHESADVGRSFRSLAAMLADAAPTSEGSLDLVYQPDKSDAKKKSTARLLISPLRAGQ